MRRITIDPVTRIEGHLKLEVVIDEGRVKEAHCAGMLFRGLEVILRGRDPRDATRITQRVCGVCPTAHALASSRALDEAFGITDRIPINGRLLRNLIMGSNYVQSHLLHFYHLAALDYVDVAAAADYAGSDPRLRQLAAFLARGSLGPFVPREEGDYRLTPELNRALAAHYIEALDRRREAQEMLAVFGGKMPHNMGVFVGGALEQVSVDKIAEFRFRLERLRDFVERVYIPDVLAVAKAYPDYFEIGRGCERYLSYGSWEAIGGGDTSPAAPGILDGRSLAFEPLDPVRITEDVTHSWYSSGTHLPPSHGETEADPRKPGAYTFLKAPRYDGEVCEVGPLARMLAAYVGEDARVRALVDGALAEVGAGVGALSSVLGRHAARAIECKLVADAMAEWVLALRPGEPSCAELTVPEEGRGMGLVGAPRGALGHWIEIRDGVIANYQVVAPTTWNLSPRDDAGRPGPCEQALEGAPLRDPENPFELLRIVRSFDPCLACSVQMVSPKGRSLGRFAVS